MRRLIPYLLVLLLGLYVHGPALRVPFAVDDYAHEAMMDGSWPLRRAPWDMFNFVDGSRDEVRRLTDAGALAWWSHPELKFRFFRPITSLSRALDHKLFGSDALRAHWHSMAWFVACCAGVALLARRTIGERAGPLAMAFFALDGSHTLPIGWLANRSFLVSTAFGAFALWRYCAYWDEAKRRDAIASSALFALSLLGGEYGLCLCAYAVAHTIVARPGAASRAKTACIWAVPLIVWALIYAGFGFGSAHSDAYLDPLRRTAEFIANAPERWCSQVGELYFSVPADGPSPFRWSPLRARWTGAGLLAAIAAALYVMRPVPAALRWLALGTALAIIPVLPSFGTSRLLMGPQIGVAAVMAVLVVRVVESLLRRSEKIQAKITAFAALVPALALVAIHLVYGPQLARFRARDMQLGHDRELSMIQRATVRREGLSDARVVLIAAVDGQTLLYPPWIWKRVGVPIPRSWLGLTGTAGLYRLRRPEPDTLVLEAFTGRYMTDQPEMMFRARASMLREGSQVELDHVTISVEQLRAVRRVSFRFRESIDSAFRLMVMDERGMREVPLPAVGGAMIVPTARVPD